MELKRQDVIPWTRGCPVCGGSLTYNKEIPSGSLPIDSECKHCGMYYDSYHGMGDSVGRIGSYENAIFSYGWSGAWDEQGYLSAILAARQLLRKDNVNETD